MDLQKTSGENEIYMNLTPEEIEKNRNDPEKMLQIVSTLTKAIDIDEQKQQKMRQLRWEFTRQMHNKMPIFWLEGIHKTTLFKIFRDWCKEYEIVFGKQYSGIHDALWRAAEDWKTSQRMKYEKQHEKVIA